MESLSMSSLISSDAFKTLNGHILTENEVIRAVDLCSGLQIIVHGSYDVCVYMISLRDKLICIYTLPALVTHV